MKKFEPLKLLSPIGRLVQGSLYDPITTDLDNKPIKYKTGKKTGQDAARYYFAVAIKKGKEKSWKMTEWGKKIADLAEREAAPGATERSDFAWKIEDGDDDEPNQNHRRNCDLEGYPGNWVIKFSTFIAPQIVNAKAEQLTQEGFIKTGYFVQVYFSVVYNNPAHKTTVKNGLFLNPEIVSFQAYGEEITQFHRPDPKAVGFGGQLPAGASLTPISQLGEPGQEFPVVEDSILDPDVFEEDAQEPPAPPAPPSIERKVSKGGHTWDLSSMIKKGWTEDALASAGYTFI